MQTSAVESACGSEQCRSATVGVLSPAPKSAGEDTAAAENDITVIWNPQPYGPNGLLAQHSNLVLQYGVIVFEVVLSIDILDCGSRFRELGLGQLHDRAEAEVVSALGEG